jgi:aspartyl-tRNA synthetase
MHRTHHLGELRKSHQGETVTVAGWVNAIRHQGAGIHFLDLRDRYGMTQIMVDGSQDETKEALVKTLRSEFVLKVTGEVLERPEGLKNPHIETGEIEIQAKEMKVLSPAEPLPFEVSQKRDRKTGEILWDEAIPIELRLKHRYLDFRRIPVLERLKLRSRLFFAIREFFTREGFLEVETPILLKATPEGARDFLVPSRKSPGEFYALPQSPQLLKQILMVGGVDKYYQLAKCFRDEDSRRDRQPEFTQLDLEMSYVSEEGDIISLVERLIQYLMKEIRGEEISIPFSRLSYEEAMASYASDKPDLRFALKVIEFTDLLKEHEVFRGLLKKGSAKGFCLTQGASAFSNKDLKELSELQAVERPVYFAKVVKGQLQGGFAGKTTPEQAQALLERSQAKEGDLIVVVTGESTSFEIALDKLRRHFGKVLKLYDHRVFHYSWVVDFPLFEWDEKEQRLNSMHHPFTSPQEEVIEAILKGDEEALKANTKAKAYDLVLNGLELGGGSIRIHNPQLQEKVFSLLKIPEKEAKTRFGFFLEALQYGTPPHGGIALGMDRFVALLLGTENIIEAIPFPKSFNARCFLTEAPTPVDALQMEELGIILKADLAPKTEKTS